MTSVLNAAGRRNDAKISAPTTIVEKKTNDICKRLDALAIKFHQATVQVEKNPNECFYSYYFWRGIVRTDSGMRTKFNPSLY